MKTENQVITENLEQRFDEIKLQTKSALRNNRFAEVARLAEWLVDIQDELRKLYRRA